MKKILALITFLIIINLLFPFRTYADIGPKPSIKLIGVGGKYERIDKRLSTRYKL